MVVETKVLNKGEGKNRFVYKSFKERLQSLDVAQTFRTLAPTRVEPREGSSCFTHEALLHWKELNTTAIFTDVYREFMPRCQSLPLLLLHKDALVATLLGVLRMQHVHSLDAFFGLLGSLARDLQREFLPYAPAMVSACIRLLAEGGTADISVLDQMFSSLALVFRFLVKPLASDVLLLLRLTQELRCHHKAPVRQFTAEATAYVLRHAPLPQLQKGVHALMTEVAWSTSGTEEERRDGASAVLAEALKGVSNGFHSRAPTLLELLVAELLHKPGVRHSATSALDQSTAAAETHVSPPPDSSNAEEALSISTLAMVDQVLARVCAHVGRAEIAPMWAALLSPLSTLLADLEQELASQAGGGSGKGEVEPGSQIKKAKISKEGGISMADKAAAGGGAVGAGVDRGGHVAQLSGKSLRVALGVGRLLFVISSVVEFRNGSAVNDFAPHFKNVLRLLPVASSFCPINVTSPPPPPRARGQTSEGTSGQPRETEGGRGANLAKETGRFVMRQTLRLLLAVVNAHGQEAGASKGPRAIAAIVPEISAAFRCPDMALVLEFVEGLVTSRMSSATQLFSRFLLRSLNRVFMLSTTFGMPAPASSFFREALSLLHRLHDQLASSAPSPLSTLGLLRTADCAHTIEYTIVARLTSSAHVLASAARWEEQMLASGAGQLGMSTLPGQHGGEGMISSSSRGAPSASTNNGADASRSAIATASAAGPAAPWGLSEVWTAAQVAILAAASSEEGVRWMNDLIAATEEALATVTPTATQPSNASHKPSDAAARSYGSPALATPGKKGSADGQDGRVPSSTLAKKGSLAAAPGARPEDTCGDKPSDAGAAAPLPPASRGLLAVLGAAMETRAHFLQGLRAEALRVKSEVAAGSSNHPGGDGDLPPALAGNKESAKESKKERKKDAKAERRAGEAKGSGSSGSSGLNGSSGLVTVVHYLEHVMAAVEKYPRAASVVQGCAATLDMVASLGSGNEGPGGLGKYDARAWEVEAKVLSDACSVSKGSTLARHLLDAASTRRVLGFLQGNFSSPSRRLRVASLRVVCQMRPLATDAGATGGGGGGAAEGKEGKKGATEEDAQTDLFSTWLSINSATIQLQQGQHWAIALRRIASDIEVGGSRVPESYAEPLAHCLLGALNTPLAVLWDPAHEVFKALATRHVKTLWAVLFPFFQATQEDVLAGGDNPRSQQAAAADLEPSANGGMQPVEDIGKLFQLAATPPADATRRSTLLASLVAALHKMPLVAERFSRDWVPLFLAFASARDRDPDGEGSKPDGRAEWKPQGKALALGSAEGSTDRQPQGLKSASQRASLAPLGAAKGKAEGETRLVLLGTTAWTAVAKEYLTLLKNVPEARNLYKSQEVKDRLYETFLVHNDPSLQALALSALTQWKLPFLSLYLDRLQRLAEYKTTKHEMALFDIRRESGVIQSGHRAELVELITRILFPKLKKKKGRLAGKVTRSNVLVYLARLDAAELQPLLKLVLAPVKSVFRPDRMNLMAGPGASCQLDSIDAEALQKLNRRQLSGFLHVAVDIVDTMGELAVPYLDVLLSPVLVALRLASAGSPAGSGGADGDEGEEGEGEEAGAHKGTRGRDTPTVTAGLLGGRVSNVVGARGMDADEDEAMLGGKDDGEQEGDEGLDEEEEGEEDDAMEDTEDKEAEDESEEEEESESEEEVEEEAEGANNKRKRDGRVERAGTSKGESEGKKRLSSGKRVALEDGDEEDDASGSGKGRKEGPDSAHGDGWQSSLLSMKEVRALCLRFVDALLRKFADKFCALPRCRPYWDAFFAAVRPAVRRLRSSEVSNNKASTLLRCLRAFSAQPSLMPLLGSCDPGLLPALFQCLAPGEVSSLSTTAGVAGTTASSPGSRLVVQGSVMDVLENILAAGPEGEALLQPHLQQLLASLLKLVESMQRHAPSAAGHSSSRGERAEAARTHARLLRRILGVLVQVSDRVHDPLLASALLDVLLRFTRSKDKKAAAVRETSLRVVERLATCVAPADAERAINALAVSLADLRSRGARSALCSALAALSAKDAAFREMALLLKDLNAMSEETVDDYNYDARLAAYARIDEDPSAFFSRLSRRVAAPLLFHSVFDMGEDDLALRQSGLNVLIQLVRYVGGLNDPGVVHQPDHVGSLITRMLYPHIKNAMKVHKEVTRQEFLMLLHEMVRHLPDLFAELRCLLCPADPEVDFFLNITHVQAHRRARAIARIRAVGAGQPQGSEGSKEAASPLVPISQATLNHLLAPLCVNIILEADPDPTKSSGTVEEAIKTLGWIGGRLSWSLYSALLHSLFYRIPKNPTHERLLVRTGCSLLDNFHFHVLGGEVEEGPGLAGEAKEGALEAAKAGVVAVDSAKGQPAAPEAEGAAAGEPTRKIPDSIVATLTSRTLPTLFKYMAEGEEVLRSHVAVAIVKLLLLLPRSVLDAELPRVIQGVVNVLKNRKQGVRDRARETLTAVVAELGPTHLGAVLDVMRASLDRGYMRHILGFSVHAVLMTLVPRLGTGDLDDVVEMLCDILEGDIFETQVSEERDVGAISGSMKEAKRSRSFDSFRWLAQLVTFDSHIRPLLRPALSHVHRVPSSATTKGKVTDILRHVSQGLMQNPTATSEDLLRFIFGVITDGLNHEAEASALSGGKRRRQQNPHERVAVQVKAPRNDAGAADFVAKKETDGTGLAGPEAIRLAGEVLPDEEEDVVAAMERKHKHGFYVVVEFALQLLHSSLKHGRERERAHKDGAGGAQGGSRGGGDDDDDGADDSDDDMGDGGDAKGEKGAGGKGPKAGKTGADGGRDGENETGGAGAGDGGPNAREAREATREMLGALVPLLVRCLMSRHAQVACLSMKCLTHLVRRNLPATAASTPLMTKSLLSLLQKSVRASSPLAQDALKLLTSLMLHAGPEFTLKELQLSELLKLAFADMEASETTGTTFGLLKALLMRKLISPVIYDVMVKVSELMVRSHSAVVRQQASQCLLQFLLDYPLGSTRLQQHLDFLVINLEYEYEAGREAVLEMLHLVVVKFPLPILLNYVDFFFLPLVTCLVNDGSPQVRAMAGAVIKKLLSRLVVTNAGNNNTDKDASGAAAGKLDALVGFVMVWLGSSHDPALQRIGAQATGLIVQVMGASFERHLAAVLGPAAAILSAAAERTAQAAEAAARNGGSEGVDALAGSAGAMGSEEAVGGGGGGGANVYLSSAADGDMAWQAAYYTLTSLEKVLHTLPHLVLDAALRDTWRRVEDTLLHTHLWVRKAAGRLLGILLGALASATPTTAATTTPISKSSSKINNNSSKTAATAAAGISYWHARLRDIAWLSSLADCVCRQLSSPHPIEDKMADQCIKNLLFLAQAIHAAREPGERAALASRAAAAKAARATAGAMSGAKGAGDSRTGEDVGGQGAVEDAEEEDGSAEEDGSEEEEGARKGGRVHEGEVGAAGGGDVAASYYGLLKKDPLWISFRHMKFVASKGASTVQRCAALRWFAAASSALGATDVEPYLPHIVAALFRITQVDEPTSRDEELTSLAEEVSTHVRNLVGVTPFVDAYNEARKAHKASHDERKKKRATLALVDPEAHARKKIKRSKSKQASRKRKLEDKKRRR
eukprot:jgi/Mesvir1/15397/Mv06583-RA.2